MSTAPSPVGTLVRVLLMVAVLVALAGVWTPQLKHSYREAHLAAVNEQMLTAAAAGDLDGVAQAISDGAQAEWRDDRGRSALSLAVEHGNDPLVELLLGEGAGRQDGGERALAIAVRKNELALARHLLEGGVDPNWHAASASALHICIEQGAIEMLDLLLEFGADIEYEAGRSGDQNSSRMTPLFAAIRYGSPDEIRLQMVHLLLERGADPNVTGIGPNAMDLAIQIKNAPLGDLLREHGVAYGPREAVAFGRFGEVQGMIRENPALVEMRYRPYMMGRPGQEPTLLGIALLNGDGQMARFLIDQGAPLDVLEGFGGTLLHAAARGGDGEIIRLLVDSGLEVDARTEFQDTPLTDCFWNEAPDESIFALIQAGADVNARGRDDLAVLGLAVSRNRIEAVRRLIAAGADPNAADAKGQTAIGIARKHRPELVEMLEAATEPPATDP